MRGRWGALKTLEMTYATSNINFEISGQAVHFSGQSKLHNRTIQNKKLFFLNQWITEQSAMIVHKSEWNVILWKHCNAFLW